MQIGTIYTLPTGVTPKGIATTHNKAYVVNDNNYHIPDQASVMVINLRDKSVLTTIYDKSFNEPYTINISGRRAYVTNSNSTTITIIDIKYDKVIGIIDGFDGPSGMVIKDNKIGYVNNYGGPNGVGSGNGTTISVVDLINKVIIDTIEVDLAPASLAISPSGKYVYVINYVDGKPGTGTFNVIDTRSNNIIHTTTGLFGPFNIAITPNGAYAYITNFGSNDFAPFGNTVAIIDLSSYKIVNTIIVGIQPSGVAIDPRGKYAYVTNYNTLYAGPNFTKLTPGQGLVSIIDIEKQKVLPKTIVVNQSPANNAITDDGHYLLVTNFVSNTVNIISLNC